MPVTPTPFRRFAWQGHAESSNSKRVQLPENEQVARGQKLLSMLQAEAHDKIEKHSTAKLDTVPNCAQDSEADTEATMIVKHTFIEFVATPKNGRRRALTDSAIDDDYNGNFSDSSTIDTGAAASGSRTPLAELSEASHSDTEEPVALAAPKEIGQMQQDWSEMNNSTTGFDVHDPSAYDASSQMAWGSMDRYWWPQSMGQWPCTDMQSSYAGEFANAYLTAATSGIEGGHFIDAERVLCKPVDRALHTIDEVPETQKTTVMLRNLPTSFTRSKFLELLEDEGFEGSFDFVYLPIDFGTGCILGYAFVNFISASDAARCWQNFDSFKEWGMPSDKICEMTWGHPHQGLQAHIERYQNSPVMHESVPDSWKPAVFVDGMRVPFPCPTKKIKAPQMKTKSKAKAERR